MRAFTIVTVLDVLGIPFVGYAMDTWGFRVTLALTVGLGWPGPPVRWSPTRRSSARASASTFRTFVQLLLRLGGQPGLPFFRGARGRVFLRGGRRGPARGPVDGLRAWRRPTFPDAAGKTAAESGGGDRRVRPRQLGYRERPQGGHPRAPLFLFPLTGTVGRPGRTPTTTGRQRCGTVLPTTPRGGCRSGRAAPGRAHEMVHSSRAPNY